MLLREAERGAKNIERVRVFYQPCPENPVGSLLCRPATWAAVVAMCAALMRDSTVDAQLMLLSRHATDVEAVFFRLEAALQKKGTPSIASRLPT